MHRRILTALAGALALCATLPAHAVGSLVDVLVVDRDTGRTLAPIRYQGEWWIAGRPGARYGVTLLSRNGQRTLNVVSVDGVNAISGDTAAWGQTGYVLDGYQRTRIDGWRKNLDQVAAFEFTALPDSYAARTGRPANVGVIGIATFVEQPPRAPIARRDAMPATADRASGSSAPSSSMPGSSLPAPSPAESRDEAEPSQSSLAKANSLADLSMQRSRIGTGHGAIEESSIRYVNFQRAQPTPNEIITIHYDRAENLIAMGIMPPPYTPPVATTRANPFPDSGRFVADPPPR